jgi:putative membrane protein insertion efficiency factor
MLGVIAWYQGQRDGYPSPCRFFPTCSHYAAEAIETHGPWRGGWLTVRRLVRCRPFGPSGFDPVPSTHEDCPTHIGDPRAAHESC